MDKFQTVILQYQIPQIKTPNYHLQCVYSADLIPILPGKYQSHSVWKESLSIREEALRKRHMANHERWTEHTRLLPPLSVADHVMIHLCI